MDRPPEGAKIKKHSLFGDMILNAEELDIFCVSCGATENIFQDPSFEDVFYCLTCLEKADKHQEAINYGYKEEDPTDRE